MLIVEDIKRGALATVALGATAVFLVPVVLPAVMHAARPLLKEAVKGGILCLRKGADAMAGACDTFSGIVAEARADLEAGKAKPAPKPDQGDMDDSGNTGEPSPEVMG